MSKIISIKVTLTFVATAFLSVLGIVILNSSLESMDIDKNSFIYPVYKFFLDTTNNALSVLIMILILIAVVIFAYSFIKNRD